MNRRRAGGLKRRLIKLLITKSKAKRYRKLVLDIQAILINTNSRRIDFGYTEIRLPYDELTEKQKQRNCYSRGWRDGSHYVISEIYCLFERWGIDDKR